MIVVLLLTMVVLYTFVMVVELTVVLLMLIRFIVLPADVVRRHVNFSRTQRKPSHIAAEASSTANKDH